MKMSKANFNIFLNVSVKLLNCKILYLNFLQETSECRGIGGEKVADSDMDQDSSDDEMYVEETSDDDEEEDEAPTRHRLEWDDGL